MADPPSAPERGGRAAREPGRPQRRGSLATSTLANLGAQIGGHVLGLLNVVIIARVLGPSGRGEVVFLMAMASIVSRLSAFGIQEAHLTFVPDSARRLPPAIRRRARREGL